MSKAVKYVVALTAATVIEGVIRKRGEEVELTKAEAENLLYRGRAEIIGSDEANEDQVIDLGKMEKVDLVELATEYGIENADALTVDQLREEIKAAVAAE